MFNVCLLRLMALLAIGSTVSFAAPASHNTNSGQIEGTFAVQAPGASSSIDKTSQRYFTSFWQRIFAPFTKIRDFIFNYSLMQEHNLAGNFAQANNFFVKLLLAFLAGLTVSLTPCIYPLIPVTAGVINLSRSASRWKQVGRALAYILGLSSVFAGLGYLAATSSLIFGQWFAHPWFIAGMICFYLFLAFGMFGLYEVNWGILDTLAPVTSSIFSTFLFGATSGLVASPCMTPALMTILSYVTTQTPFSAMAILFSFALGMAFILLLVALFSGLVQVLPKPGFWMVEVKRFVGFVILFLCVDLISPFLVPYTTTLLYACLFALMTTYYYFAIRAHDVLNIVRMHDSEYGTPRKVFFLVNFRTLLKRLIFCVCLFWTMFFVVRTYLLYNRTTVRRVLISALT